MEKISVVMCSYNGGKYIREQLDSILSQTYPLYEIIIQDDGSTDDTCEIIEEYQAKYSIIKLIRNERNLGFNLNFLDAITKATGDFIATSDQDDIWEPVKIERLLNCLETRGGQVSFGRSDSFNDKGERVRFFDERTPNYSVERLILANIAPGHNMLIRKEFIKNLSVPQFQIYYKWFWDEYIAVVAAAREELVFCNEYLVHYRRHADQATGASSTTLRPKMNLLAAVADTAVKYFKRRDEMLACYSAKNSFLKTIDCSNEHLSNALKFTRLSSRRDPLSVLRLQFHCLRRRKYIFFSQEVKPFILAVRAFFFPFYCANYFD